MNRQRVLVWLMRLTGCFLLLAFIAVFMPTSWMASVHDRLGIGTFPDSPIVQYLTRSISAMYAMHGGIVLVLSTDVARYRIPIQYLGFANIIFGALMVGIDVYAGIPLLWLIAEGPPLMVTGALILWLNRQGE